MAGYVTHVIQEPVAVDSQKIKQVLNLEDEVRANGNAIASIAKRLSELKLALDKKGVQPLRDDVGALKGMHNALALVVYGDAAPKSL